MYVFCAEPRNIRVIPQNDESKYYSVCEFK